MKDVVSVARTKVVIFMAHESLNRSYRLHLDKQKDMEFIQKLPMQP
jgi:hypothetical protein